MLARRRAFWLRRPATIDPNRSSIVETVSLRGATSPIGDADRAFAAGVDAIGLGPASVPQLLSGGGGVTLIDPPLYFAP